MRDALVFGPEKKDRLDLEVLDEVLQRGDFYPPDMYCTGRRGHEHDTVCWSIALGTRCWFCGNTGMFVVPQH